MREGAPLGEVTGMTNGKRGVEVGGIDFSIRVIFASFGRRSETASSDYCRPVDSKEKDEQ